MKYIIRKNCTSIKDFPITEKEIQFFDCLHSKLSDEQNCHIRLFRMSNGSISVYFDSYPIGKIKLYGQRFWMQILKGLYSNKTVEGTVEQFIEHIPEWQRYIELHCK